jgi:uncharacterized protein (DUF1697 family)
MSGHHHAMPTRVAFLRAVNVGRRKVSMAKLVEVCESLGYHDVWTHANSGNVVFDTAKARPSIERSMTGALEDAFGFEVTTFVRSAAELRKALDAHPFPVGTGDTYFITFLRTPPSAATKRALEAASNDFDTLVVKGRDVHWRMRGKSTDTTVPRATWGVVGEHGSTSRNVTLLERLSAKIAAG